MRRKPFAILIPLDLLPYMTYTGEPTLLPRTWREAFCRWLVRQWQDFCQGGREFFGEFAEEFARVVDDATVLSAAAKMLYRDLKFWWSGKKVEGQYTEIAVKSPKMSFKNYLEAPVVSKEKKEAPNETLARIRQELQEKKIFSQN